MAKLKEGWGEYLGQVSGALENASATGRNGEPIDIAHAFDRWVALTRTVHDAGGRIYFVGNGGSAMIASHMAVDLTKNGGLRAMAFNDAAWLTAISNDMSFDDAFAAPLRWLGAAGDLLISISSSGNSPNVIRVLEAAREIGVHTVTLSGKSADNRSRRMGDLNFYVPADRYGWVESAHQILIHYWFDQYLNLHRDGAL